MYVFLHGFLHYQITCIFIQHRCYIKIQVRYNIFKHTQSTSFFTEQWQNNYLIAATTSSIKIMMPTQYSQHCILTSNDLSQGWTVRNDRNPDRPCYFRRQEADCRWLHSLDTCAASTRLLEPAATRHGIKLSFMDVSLQWPNVKTRSSVSTSFRIKIN